MKRTANAYFFLSYQVPAPVKLSPEAAAFLANLLTKLLNLTKLLGA